jgi:hypothetical protein
MNGERVARRWLWFWAIAITVMYALLWSPQWYPLSDSALYLAMGRSWAAGNGLTVQGHAVDLVPPIVPVMFGIIMKAGGGIGAIQAVLIGFLLAAHGLAFLALRRWVGERLALAGVVAGAMSYWVFYNACTIMTEPVAMALAWGGMWGLAGAKLREGRGVVRAVLAGVLFGLAALSRDAAVLLLPGVAVVMWSQNRGETWRVQGAWMVLLGVMMGALLVQRVSAKYQLRGERDPFLVEKTGRDGDDDEEQQGVRTKSFRVMNDVPRDWRLATHPPMLLGRWVGEGLVGPLYVVFKARGAGVWGVGYGVGLLAALLFVAGVAWWWRRGGWWAVIPLLYLLPIWGQWGARVKPRYLGLVGPLLLLVLAGGVVGIWAWWKRRPDEWVRPVAYVLCGLVAVGNLPAWVGEAYVRRQVGRDFYEVARQGASASLVDIGGYLQKHAGAEETVWFNRGAERRVAHFLCGRRLLVRDVVIRTWEDSAGIAGFLDGIPAGDRWAIVYVEEPVAGWGWPRWHFGVKRAPAEARFYRLMERGRDAVWREVEVPVDREYVRAIPATTK